MYNRAVAGREAEENNLSTGAGALAWSSWTIQTWEGEQGSVDVLVGPVSPASDLTRFLLPLQRTHKCQNLPQSPRPHLPGLSHPRALRGCSQQDLSLGAWIGPQSRTVLGRRPALTTPMRGQGSLLSPIASPGQDGRKGRPGVGGNCQGWPRLGSRKRGKATGDHPFLVV